MSREALVWTAARRTARVNAMTVRRRAVIVVVALLFAATALFFFLVPVSKVAATCGDNAQIELCQLRDVTTFQLLTHSYPNPVVTPLPTPAQ